MISFLRIISVLTVVLSAVTATAADYVMKSLSINDGLSQNTVNTMLRDSRGFLWIGTNHGLNRYDNSDHGGLRNYFSTDNGVNLRDDHVLSVNEDSHGGIWILTLYGVTRYDPRTEQFRELTYNGNNVRSGTTWMEADGVLLGTDRGEILRFDFRADSLVRLPVEGLPKKKAIRFMKWRGDSLLMLTRIHGLWTFDPAGGKARKLDYVRHEGNLSATIDHKGNLWVAPYDNGIECYSPDGVLLRRLTADDGIGSNIVTDLLPYGNEIIVSSEAGIVTVDPESGRVTPSPYGVTSRVGAVRSLYIDRNDKLYIGTVRNGVMMFKEVSMRTFRLNPSGSYEGTVTSFCDAGNGMLWCGVDGGGVVELDSRRNKVSPVKSTAGRKVLSLARWPEGKMLVSTYADKLTLVDIASGSMTDAPASLDRISDNAHREAVGIGLMNMPDGRLLALTDSVYLIDPKAGTVRVAHSPRDNHTIGGMIYPIYCDSEKAYMWWYKTIYRFDPETCRMDVVATTPDNAEIHAVAHDGHETMYIATSLHLYSFNMTYNESELLETNVIRNVGAMICDRGDLWIGGSQRLFMLDGSHLMSFDASDGVVANEYLPQSVYADSTYIYFGGSNGVTRIHRASTAATARSRCDDVHIHLAELTLNGVSVMGELTDGHLHVPARNSTLSIRVVNDERNSMRSRTYRFYIDGIKGARPYDALNPMLSISDLPPGSTVGIRVSCTLPDGSWSKPRQLLVIDVDRLWWQTWWFILILIAAFAAVVMLAVRALRQHWRNESNLHRQHLLERDVQILANINESLRTPLARVAEPVEKAVGMLERCNISDRDALLAAMREAMRQIDAMRAITESPFEIIHPQSLSIDPIRLSARFNVWLSGRVEAFVKASRADRYISVDFRPDYDPGSVTFDAARMEMIVTCIMSEFVGDGVRRISVTVEEDEPTGATKVVFADPSAGNPDDFVPCESNLRMLYAQWLAEPAGVGVEVRCAASGERIASVTLLIADDDSDISGDGLGEEAESGDGDDNTDDVAEPRETTDCVVAVIDSDQRTAEFIKNKGSDGFRDVEIIRDHDPGRIMAGFAMSSPDFAVIEGSAAGIELCRRIKSDPDLAGSIFVVMLTSGSTRGLKEQTFRVGADAYIEKPFDISVLVRLCRQLLREG